MADYRGAVELLNRRRSEQASSAREAARRSAREHAETMRQQRDVADLLDESG